jgi:hypothetical protein
VREDPAGAVEVVVVPGGGVLGVGVHLDQAAELDRSGLMLKSMNAIFSIGPSAVPSRPSGSVFSV